jgi:alkanesulfonate monooxygenase SsuD/methylene tetrahydromethanopterin reductase-like flavin-dependent oxidoreductase (luciferase family)
MVTSPNYRHPVTLAKDAMTLDHISGGRLTLGVGAGGIGFDATVLGGTVLTPAARAARLAEFVDTLDGLLRNPAYSHSGEFYTVDEARMIPGCVQLPRVPLALAAAGPKTLALAARQGDAWITFGDANTEDSSPAAVEAALRRQTAVLEQECERIGRDPATIDRVFLSGGGNAEERPLRSVEAFREFAQRTAALGFTDLVVHDPRPADPEWDDDPEVITAIAREVLPELA